jgi:arsenate reductase
MKREIILFVCKGNSGRSQMAEAFFNTFSRKMKVRSAGTKPDDKIHPWTVQLMKEVEIDVSQQKPKLLTNKLMNKADKIIVMDSELLNNIPKKYLPKTEEWKIEKVFGKSMKQVRKIRNQIEKRVEQLIEMLENKWVKNKNPRAALRRGRLKIAVLNLF